jgi:hypothetical protein
MWSSDMRGGDRVDGKKLAGSNQWRLRAGDWRVILEPEGDGGFLVSRVVNRRDAYE